MIAFSGVPSQTSLPTSLRSQQNLQYRFFALSPQGQARQKSGRNRLTSALLDTLRDEEEIGGAKRINLFRLAIRSWLTFSQIALPLMQDESKQRKYVTLSRLTSLKGSEFFEAHAEVDASQPPMFFARQRNTPSPLSSGQELFFRFALNLCASIEIGTLVLVDEPENHLHPNFITHLMALLRDILVRTGSFALVASHSAFVVREVTAKDVSIMSRAEDGSPTIRRPRLQTLGASVEAVSSYVFGDETVPALARLTVDALKDLPDVDFELTLNRLHTEFSNEAISHIRSEILKRQRGSFE
ncbi:AAA family ATPase [Variovorax sp. GB1R11]|uniref:AAA family ATPase n=1 Tax=Variovorax sp. GB1R11 TaxID=3443741 RepID=UPI003F45DABF